VRPLRGFVVLLLALVLAASLAASGHVAHAFLQPDSARERVASQVRWLDRAIAEGAAPRMQGLFPEGALFTHVLTGLAAASVGDRDTVDATLAASGSAEIKDGFGRIEVLDGGTFYRGWRLLLQAEQVRLTGAGRAELAAEAAVVRQALVSSPIGVPPSYPDGYWPCDAVVAMAAVARAGEVAGVPIEPSTLAAWRTKLGALRDPATGLLAHRIRSDGRIAEGPRGSSQAIVQSFWPDVDPSGAAEQWRLFTTTFVVRELGLVGVREFPVGDGSAGDVDSGPLVLGVSASASAVTLAAARRNGDAALAATLDHEAEYLGVPLEWAGERRFGFGVLPVGDAFVAWARGVPLVPTPSDGSPITPDAWWWAHALVLLLPGALAGWGLLRMRRRTRPTA